MALLTLVFGRKVSTNTLGGCQSPTAPLELDASPSHASVANGIVGFVVCGVLSMRRLKQQAVCLFRLPELTVYQFGLVATVSHSTWWLLHSLLSMSNVRSLRTASVAVAARCWDTLSWPPLGSSTMMLSPSSSLLSSHG
jgi:hypothetical protein